MASANITLTEDVATIVVDDVFKTATKSPASISGYLVNAGTKTVFITTGGTAAPATTDAQATGTIGILTLASAHINSIKGTFTYVCKSGESSVLYWIPD